MITQRDFQLVISAFNNTYSDYRFTCERELEKFSVIFAVENKITLQTSRIYVDDLTLNGYTSQDILSTFNKLLDTLIEYEEKEEVSEMSKVIKKKVGAIDPTKVKKPECVVHNSPMNYNPSEDKWECTEPDCVLVARPKRTADDRTVVLGKGGVSMRVINEPGKDMAVVLFTDDNVAIDITRYVNTTTLVNATKKKVTEQEAGNQFPESIITLEENVRILAYLPTTVYGRDQFMESKA